jgi:hypothetical protein
LIDGQTTVFSWNAITSINDLKRVPLARQAGRARSIRQVAEQQRELWHRRSSSGKTSPYLQHMQAKTIPRQCKSLGKHLSCCGKILVQTPWIVQVNDNATSSPSSCAPLSRLIFVSIHQCKPPSYSRSGHEDLRHHTRKCGENTT